MGSAKLKIRKGNIKPLLRALSKDWRVYAPIEGVGGDVQFREISEEGSSLERLNLNYSYLVNPPKSLFFPQLEPLLEFGNGEVKEALPPPSPKILFGLRACDVKALAFTDGFFKRGFEDVYYLTRAKDRLTVIVACKGPLRGCFCTSTGTGPFLEEGFDLQLIDIGEEYVVEVGSNSGRELVDALREFFEEASEGEAKIAERAKQEAARAVDSNLRVNFQGAVEKLIREEVPPEVYQQMAEKCMECGGCVYVCPTCTCFNVFDDGEGGSGFRYRNWDACIFSGYSRETSGYNPRAEKWKRIARRFEHKIRDDYLETGVSGCVGCGRCFMTCPVNIGMSNFIREIAG